MTDQGEINCTPYQPGDPVWVAGYVTEVCGDMVHVRVARGLLFDERRAGQVTAHYISVKDTQLATRGQNDADHR